MPKTLVTAKNYVAARKTKILVTALTITTTMVVLQRTGLRQHDSFLAEHGLLDAFYTPVED